MWLFQYLQPHPQNANIIFRYSHFIFTNCICTVIEYGYYSLPAGNGPFEPILYFWPSLGIC
jgi:hypothetical protein